MNILGKIKNFCLVVLMVAFLLFAVKIIIGQFKFEKITPTEISTPTPIEKEESVELVRVVDGDTVIIKINDKEESVRLIGINAPEKNECYSKEATDELKKILVDKNIKIETDESQNDKDKYDRLLRYIYLEDGTFVNEKLVKDGFAKEYTYKIAYKFQIDFKNDQKMAVENKLGMWADGVCNNL